MSVRRRNDRVRWLVALLVVGVLLGELAASRQPAFVGDWGAPDGRELISLEWSSDLGRTGDYWEGETLSVQGKWRVVAPGVIEVTYTSNSREVMRSIWAITADRKTLTLTDESGRSSAWSRR